MADPEGVAIAFTGGPHAVAPTWTRVDTLPGCRVQEWSVSRGRPTEFEKVAAGTAHVRIADLEGLFDPTNGFSAYFPSVKPDLQAAIALYNPVLEEWQTIFRGFVEDWNYTLEATRQVLWLELDLVDAFGYLNDTELMPGVHGDTPPSGSEGNVVYGATAGTLSDRLDAICADVGWPSGLSSFYTGNTRATMAVYPPGYSALAALQDTADAEFCAVAVLYVNREGTLVFHGRQPRFRPDVAEYGIRRQDVGDDSATTLDPTVCPISEFGFNLGKGALYNSVLVYPRHTSISGSAATEITEPEIAAQLVEDSSSKTAHGTKSLSFTELLTIEGIADSTTALEETLLMATYFRDNYQEPLPRINRLVFKSRMPDAPLAGPLWRMMTRVDISDLLTVTTAHPGGGGFSAEEYYVEGIRYQARPANDQVHDVTLELDVSPRALFDVNPFDTDPDPA